jgi:hypothetical protein
MRELEELLEYNKAKVARIAKLDEEIRALQRETEAILDRAQAIADSL